MAEETPAASASGDDLAFWAALPAAARRKIARALRQDASSKPREEAGGGEEGKEEDETNTIDHANVADVDDKRAKENHHPNLSTFRAPPRGGVSVLPGLVPASTAAQAALELDELLKEKGRPGGIGAAGGGGGAEEEGALPASAVRSDTVCWLGAEGDEEELSPALSSVRSALLSLRSSLEEEGGGQWDVGGRPSVQAAKYEAGGRYARHADEKEKEEKEEIEAESGGSEEPRGRRRRRTVTAICYLDDAGRRDKEEEEGEEGGGGEEGEEEGGELVLYPWPSRPPPSSSLSSPFFSSSSLGPEEPRVVVPPSPGLCVCFDSTLQHEVLPLVRARGPRRAVTVFFHSSSGGGGGGGKGAAAPMPTTATTATATPPTAEFSKTPTSTSTSTSTSSAAEAARRRLRITRPGHVFVSVPSFRDPETRWTLRSMLEGADRPERVAAGVVWQVSPGSGSKGENKNSENDDEENDDEDDEDDDEDLLRPVARTKEELRFYHSRVRSARLPAADSSGPCAARAVAAALWQGEEFYLSVDAHSRFSKGWDTALKKALAEAERAEEEEVEAARRREKEKGGSGGGCFPFHPVLTSYPPAYEGEGPAARIPEEWEEEEEEEGHPFATLLCASHFGPEGVMRLVAKKWRRRRRRKKGGSGGGGNKEKGEPSPFAPIRSLFWAAGFSFSRAHFAVCPPTRYEGPESPFGSLWTRGLFWGEEHDVAARALSAGYRFWAPPPAAVAVFTRYERSQVRGSPPVGARGSKEAAAAGRRLAAAFSGRFGDGESVSDGDDGVSDGDGDDDTFLFSKSEVEARYGPNVSGLWKDALGVDWRARKIDERARRGGIDKDDEEVEFCGSSSDGEEGKGFSIVQQQFE